MYKEILIIFFVIVIILALDVTTNAYTDRVAGELCNELEELKQNVLNQEEEKINAQMQQVESKWKDYHNVLVYYLEHGELEKVETELSTLRGKLEQKEYNHCAEEVEAMIFLLKHIQEKEQFSVQSIF